MSNIIEQASKISKKIEECEDNIKMIDIRDETNKFFEKYMDSDESEMAWGIYSRLISDIDRKLEFLHSHH